MQTDGTIMIASIERRLQDKTFTEIDIMSYDVFLH